MEQNHVVGDAAAAATRRFMADYDTVYDGVIGPWDLDRFVERSGPTRSTTRPVALRRRLRRTCQQPNDHGFNDHSATRHMHGQFADAIRAGAVQERHVIDSGAFDLAALTGEIERHRSAGDLRLG